MNVSQFFFYTVIWLESIIRSFQLPAVRKAGQPQRGKCTSSVSFADSSPIGGAGEALITSILLV